jgi:hypothetical protein
MQTILMALGAAAGLWGLHRFLGHAEDRGWIYYRKKRGSFGGLGVTSNFLNMYDPGRKHLQEVMREAEWKRDEDDDGDSPSRKRFGGTSSPSRKRFGGTSSPSRKRFGGTSSPSPP